MEQVAKAIGFLVYAVASADKHITLEEKRVVHDIVNENWKLLADSEDPFGVRAMDFIDKMFDSLEDKHVTSEEAFNYFKEVYDKNMEKFSPELVQFILDICIKTGSAFNRMNKSELVLLSRIEKLLKEN
jgi:hypothetical protein